jgi:hypothetical protein
MPPIHSPPRFSGETEANVRRCASGQQHAGNDRVVGDRTNIDFLYLMSGVVAIHGEHTDHVEESVFTPSNR